MLTQPYYPNKKHVTDTLGNTNWHQVDVVGDGSGAAFPNLDAGAFLGECSIVCRANGPYAAGSDILIAYNQASVPSLDTEGELVPGGTTRVLPGPIRSLYVRKEVATDVVEVTGRY